MISVRGDTVLKGFVILVILSFRIASPVHAGVVHGCSIGSAEDRSGEAAIQLQWSLPHDQCIIVSPGTTVTWNGNFNSHPLAGGVSPVKDDTSPISSPGDDIGSVTFNQEGDFPYFCRVHTGSMTGVIYVRATAPGNFSKTSPANEATGQSTASLLTWGSSTGASSYEYCIDTSDNNACDASWIDAGANTSADPGGLSTLSTYYWQVRANNSGGTTEANSGAWWSFTTTDIDERVFEDGFESSP